MLESLKKDDHINYESYLAVAISTAFWRTNYALSRWYWKSKGPEFSSRVIAFLHGLLVAFIGVNQCFVVDSPFEHPEWKTNYTQAFVLVASLGYFIHDLAWCLEYQREGRLILAHHVYSVLSLFRMLFKGYSGAQATCALGGMEITNPFLQARWFIRNEGPYPSVLFVSVETTFFIVFLGIRIILGSYIMYIILKQPKNEWDFIIMSSVIYLMSWMFCIDIVKYLRRRYIDIRKQAQENDLHNNKAS